MLRYIILFFTSFVCTFLTSAVLPNMALFGVQSDFSLAVMAAMVMHERSLTPVLYFSLWALSTDVLFAPSIGYYSLPYLIVGIGIYIFSAQIEARKWYFPLIVGAASWMAKELMLAFFASLLGYSSNFGKNFVSHTLPGIPFAMLWTFAAYLLLALLYNKRFMRPALASDAGDIRI